MEEAEFLDIWLNKPLTVTFIVQLEGEEHVLTATAYCDPDGPLLHPKPYVEIDTINKTVTLKYLEPEA